MPKPNPNTLNLETRLRAAAGVPAGDALSTVENAAGRLTVNAPSLGGPFIGDFERVTNQLVTAVARRLARESGASAAKE